MELTTWPPGYSLNTHPVQVSNSRVMGASPEAVWKWLIRAAEWPLWYPNSFVVSFLSGRPPDLALGTRFRWLTFGVMVTSEVIEFEPCKRLAWNAKMPGLDACHAWELQEREGGCRVVTEEIQSGWLARLNSLVFPRGMFEGYELWLRRLDEVSRD